MTIPTRNQWQTLRRYTQARIAQGRAGHALPTAANLQFQWDHAQARDAVQHPLDSAALQAALAAFAFPTLVVSSQARDRASYLQRPDLGRRIRQEDLSRLLQYQGEHAIALVIGDGLSATAIERHAEGLLQTLIPKLQQAGHSIAPLITIATQARVALGDEIGAALGAKLVLMLIGERPGLSSPDSLGIYITYEAKPGRMDSERNCISNIRPPQGLGYEQAADTACYLCHHALQRQLSGVELKDDSHVIEHSGTEQIPFFRDELS